MEALIFKPCNVSSTCILYASLNNEPRSYIKEKDEYSVYHVPITSWIQPNKVYYLTLYTIEVPNIVKFPPISILITTNNIIDKGNPTDRRPKALGKQPVVSLVSSET